MKGQLTQLVLLISMLVIPCLSSGQKHELSGIKKAEEGLTRNVDADTAYIESQIRFAKQIQVKYPDSAINISKRAAAQSIAIGYYDGAASALLSVAAIYSGNRKDHINGSRYRELAYIFCQRAIYRKGTLLTVCYMDMASPYHLKGMTDSIAWYCHKSMDAFREYKVSDSNLLANTLSNLSTAYTSSGEYDKSLRYLKEAEGIMLRYNEKEYDMIRIYANLGIVYYNLKDYTKSLLYCNKGIELSGKYSGSKQARALSFLHRTIAQTLLKVGKSNEALQHIHEAIAADKIYPTPMGQTDNYFSLALVYCKLNDNVNEEIYLKKALQAAEADQVGGASLYRIYFQLVHLYAETKRFEQALHYADLTAELKDSINSVEKVALSNKLDITYKSVEKDKDIMQKALLLSRRESELQKKNYWIAGISGGSLFLVVLLGSVYRNSRLKQRAQIEKMHLLQKEKEISNLKSVISGEERERTRLARELHDGIMVLFSAVKMSVRNLPQRHPSLLENKDLPEINLQLDHAIKELRRTAHNLMPDMLLEGGLAEAIFYFCKNLQHNRDLDIVFQHYGSMPRLQEEFELSLYRIVQELIQNIIKHASASKAIVQLNYRDDLLYITVEDNGKGFAPAMREESGMGLKSIRTRMRALNGTMDIRSSQLQGTTVYLEFDIRSVIKSKSNEHAY